MNDVTDFRKWWKPVWIAPSPTHLTRLGHAISLNRHFLEKRACAVLIQLR